MKKLFSKHLVFTISLLIVAISAGFLLSSQREIPEVSSISSTLHTQVLADVATTASPLQDICKRVEGFGELANGLAVKSCLEAVQKSMANPTQTVVVCRKFFSFSFFCHNENIPITAEKSFCQSILAVDNALLQQLVGDQPACELKVQNLKSVPLPPQGVPLVSPSPGVSIRPVSGGAVSFSLPSYPGALQVVGLAKNPSISGPIYFSLFYSKGKPSSYPVSRFLLSLGDTFLQISGQVTSAQSSNETITFSGPVDTTNKFIRCTLFTSNRQLSCTLASDGKGMHDFLIQKLPDVSFYPNTFFTSQADF